MKLLVVALVAGLVWGMCEAAAVEEKTELETELDATELDETELNEEAVQGRTLTEWTNRLWSWMGWDDDDYYDYEYGDDYDYEFVPTTSLQHFSFQPQLGYGLPSKGYEPGHDSSYSSYAPVHAAPPHPQHLGSGHPARHDSFRDDNYSDDSWSITDMMYNMALVAVPAGLLLSAFPSFPMVIPVRRRSFDGADNLLVDSLDANEAPLLKSLSDSENFVALLSQQCQQKLFCELAQIGERPDASFMQKAFYYVSTLTPDYLARRVGLAHLFRTSRANACHKIPCSTPVRPALTAPPPHHTNQLDVEPAQPDADALQPHNQ